MKWFKHFADMRFDPKIRRLISKHGIIGYGVYNAVLEAIAYQLETDSPVPDLEEGSIDIAEQFKMDTMKVEEIMQYCIVEDLFQKNDKTGRIMCLKMLSHLDNTMSSNPQIKSIIDNFKKLQVSSKDLKQIRLDELKSEKHKREKRNKEDDDKSYRYHVSEFVYISRKNYSDLFQYYPSKQAIREAIKILDDYLGPDEKRRKKYTSHYHVLKGWVLKRWKEDNEKKKPSIDISSVPMDREKELNNKYRKRF